MLHRVWRYRLNAEKDSVAYLLAQDLKGTTALDIGANKGIYIFTTKECAGQLVD